MAKSALKHVHIHSLTNVPADDDSRIRAQINSHGDLSLVAARMNLIFTSHSIDFQLIFTYFSLFVADLFAPFAPFTRPFDVLAGFVFCAFYPRNSFFLSFFAGEGSEKKWEEKHTKIFISFAIFLPPSAPSPCLFRALVAWACISRSLSCSLSDAQEKL